MKNNVHKILRNDGCTRRRACEEELSSFEDSDVCQPSRVTSGRSVKKKQLCGWSRVEYHNSERVDNQSRSEIGSIVMLVCVCVCVLVCVCLAS